MLSMPVMCASPLAPGLHALQFSAVPGLHYGATPQHLQTTSRHFDQGASLGLQIVLLLLLHLQL